MKFGHRRFVLGALAIVIACMTPLASAAELAEPPQQTPPMADDVFNNVQVLTGLTVDEFWNTMGMFASALTKDCVDCHVIGALENWDAFAEETDQIRIARSMIRMVDDLNNAQFGGVQRVTCFTCHRATSIPEAAPDLTLQYGLVENPNAMTLYPTPLAPPVEEVFDTYIEAIGGAEAVESIESVVIRGTYAGFETGHIDTPFELYAQAPDRRARIFYKTSGDHYRVYDGQNGWNSNPDMPVPLIPLSGGNLYGDRIGAILSFPARIQENFSRWVVSFVFVGEETFTVVQGLQGNERPVNFYFEESGLLTKVLYWTDTAVGPVTTMIEYSDYREVDGVMVPFFWSESWTTGMITSQLTDVEFNLPIDAARFNEPPPAF
jgi:hypothetical protein